MIRMDWNEEDRWFIENLGVHGEEVDFSFPSLNDIVVMTVNDTDYFFEFRVWDKYRDLQAIHYLMEIQRERENERGCYEPAGLIKETEKEEMW